MSETKKRKPPRVQSEGLFRGIMRVKNHQRDRLGLWLHPVQVGQWKKAIQEQAQTLFEGKRGPKPMAAHQVFSLVRKDLGRILHKSGLLEIFI